MPSGWPMSDEPLLRLARSVVAIEEGDDDGATRPISSKDGETKQEEQEQARDAAAEVQGDPQGQGARQEEAQGGQEGAPRRRPAAAARGEGPGIPNDWPFREEELAALEARRQRALEEREAKKAEKKERARRRRLGLPEEGPLPGAEGAEDGEDAEMGGEAEEDGGETGRVTSGAAMAGMVRGAMERGAEFEKRKREREEAEEGQAGKGKGGCAEGKGGEAVWTAHNPSAPSAQSPFFNPLVSFPSSPFPPQPHLPSPFSPRARTGGAQRAFMRELRAVVEAADVVLLVLDARDPLGGRCRQLEDMVARSGAHKRIVLLLNKIALAGVFPSRAASGGIQGLYAPPCPVPPFPPSDLVPRDVVQRWLAYFRRELPAVAFKASTQAQRAHLACASRPSRADPNKATAAPQPLLPRGEGEEAGGAAGAEGSECFGADTLIQLLKNYCRNKDIKTAIRVGVVGLPNVGKSSVINSLKRARVAKAGATAGVTRALQEVQLDKLVRLIDSPGVDDEAAAALRNAIRPEALLDPFAPVERILQLCPRAHLNAVYGLDEKDAQKEGAGGPVDGFLRQVAQKRGRLKKGGVPDTLAAARIVLREWNGGRIPYYTLPPSPASEAVEGAEEHEEGAALVGAWGGEFGAHEVLASEQRAWQAHSHQGGALAPAAGGAAAGHAVLPASAPATMMVTDEVEEGEEEEDEEDRAAEAGGMHVDDVDAVAAAEKAGVVRGREYLRQNEVLYEAVGILNPHRRRADKKRRKKQQQLGGEGAGEEGGEGSTRGKGKGGAAGKGGEEAEGSEGSDYDFTEQFDGMLPE
ncbi:unnamed protein product [Closterium sp. Yama58-4]|nr:unnamed protein product [Closterium sp. Yama58-4]